MAKANDTKTQLMRELEDMSVDEIEAVIRLAQKLTEYREDTLLKLESFIDSLDETEGTA